MTLVAAQNSEACDSENSHALRKPWPVATYQSLSMVGAAGTLSNSERDKTEAVVKDPPGQEGRTSIHFLQKNPSYPLMLRPSWDFKEGSFVPPP